MLPVRQDKMPVSLSNGSLTPPSTAPAMNWAESMPHEYQVRETADLSGLDNVEFGELKRLNDKMVSGSATPDLGLETNQNHRLRRLTTTNHGTPSSEL